MKSFIKLNLLTLIFAVSLKAEFHADALICLAKSAKNYTDTAKVPAASQTFCHAIETKLNKSMSDISVKEIENVVNELPNDVKTSSYHSLTPEDKRLIIEGMIQNFFDKQNKDSLKKYIDMLIFVVMEGQTIEELKPIIEKHKKQLDSFKNEKLKLKLETNSMLTLNKYATLAESIFKSIPKSVIDSLKNQGANSNLKLDIDKSYKPSMIINKAAETILKTLPQKTAEIKNIVANGLQRFHQKLILNK